jgi:predicted N-acyltransferase
MSLLRSLSEIGQQGWDNLLHQHQVYNPFLSYAFLDALHSSGSASEDTGWRMCFILVWQDEQILGALPLYEKMHSYGEYVFDWSWANAHQQHGIDYYPKLLSAIPFTPIECAKLICSDESVAKALIEGLIELQFQHNYSSSHVLFIPQSSVNSFQEQRFLQRIGVQFHWKNQNYENFDAFLAQLSPKKRKNIRYERRKVEEQGVHFKHLRGKEIQIEDWDFFKRCYDHTYFTHNSQPYLNLDFFLRIGLSMPEHILLIIAIQGDAKIAASLLIYDEKRLFGRYWGSLIELACLHFETAYYQSIEFCIANKIEIFEGGAQGEHKIARGFLPITTQSVHRLSNSQFHDAVDHFLEREKNGMGNYIHELNDHNPYKT